MHVKQAADAVRKSNQEGQGGDEDTRRPHCHATRLASPRFAATPSAAPRQQHLSLLHPLEGPPFHPWFDMPPLCPLPHPPDHPSATLLAHAVVCLLGNMLWLVYGGTLSFNRHTHTHTIPLQWIERPDKRHLDRERDGEGEREEGERE